MSKKAPTPSPPCERLPAPPEPSGAPTSTDACEPLEQLQARVTRLEQEVRELKIMVYLPSAAQGIYEGVAFTVDEQP